MLIVEQSTAYKYDGEGLFIESHLEEYNFSWSLHLTHGLFFLLLSIGLDFSMVWENNNGV